MTGGCTTEQDGAWALIECGTRARLGRGDLIDARQWFEAAYREADRTADVPAMAEAALGLCGLWVHEHRTAAAWGLVQARLELRQIAHPYLAQLVHDTDETSFLMIRDGLHGVCIERIDGSYVQSLVLKIGGSLPLYAGGGTRCLLAYSPPEVLDEVLASGPLKAFTPYTIINGVALRADVEQTRYQGYTLSYQDVTIGVAALGVPVFDHRNMAVGALSLSGITPRWTEAHMAEVLAAVRKAAQQISLKMGWQPPASTDSAPLATGVSRMTSALRRMDTRT